MESKRICIIGTGGVGGYFGARLANSGYDVTFVARGEHLKAIRNQGLLVKSINGDVKIFPAKVTDEPKGEFDLVLVAVKVWHIRELGDMLKRIVGESTVVLPLENGIEAVDLLQQFVSPSQVLGGLCRIFSSIEAPGIINHSAYDPSITFGELDNSLSDRAKEIGGIFKNSNIRFTIAEDIEKEIWIKFIFIASTSTIGALTRSSYGVYRSLSETRQLLSDVINEMVEVGIAKGVNITKKLVGKTLDFIDKMPADATTSLQRDMMEGKPSELDAQLGALIRLARKYHVTVTRCAFVYAALLPQENQARKNL